MNRPRKPKEPVKKEWSGKEQPRTKDNQFQSQYKEPRGNAIALRLPISLDEQIRAAADWHDKADNPKLKAWVEAALREKLERETHANSD